jgi:hypothetical protein
MLKSVLGRALLCYVPKKKNLGRLIYKNDADVIGSCHSLFLANHRSSNQIALMEKAWVWQLRIYSLYNYSRSLSFISFSGCVAISSNPRKIPQERVDLKNLISTIKIVNIW